MIQNIFSNRPTMHNYFQVYMIKEVKPRSETFQGTASYRSFDSHSIPRWQDRRPFVGGRGGGWGGWGGGRRTCRKARNCVESVFHRRSLFVCCLTSQQQTSVSQGRICPDNFTCYHTEIEVADQTFYLTQSQYTDTGPTSPSADPITPGA